RERLRPPVGASRPSSLAVHLVLQRPQGRRGRLAERADLTPVVLVGRLAGAVVELELFQRRERAVALLDELEMRLVAFGRGVEAVVLRGGLPQERQGDEHDDDRGERHTRSECEGRHARAGASLETSRRCSRASGQTATADPSRNTMPAIQIKLTSGLTSTFT